MDASTHAALAGASDVGTARGSAGVVTAGVVPSTSFPLPAEAPAASVACRSAGVLTGSALATHAAASSLAAHSFSEGCSGAMETEASAGISAPTAEASGNLCKTLFVSLALQMMVPPSAPAPAPARVPLSLAQCSAPVPWVPPFAADVTSAPPLATAPVPVTFSLAQCAAPVPCVPRFAADVMSGPAVEAGAAGAGSSSSTAPAAAVALRGAAARV